MLLKMDLEGHEIKALLGAGRAADQNLVAQTLVYRALGRALLFRHS